MGLDYDERKMIQFRWSTFCWRLIGIPLEIAALQCYLKPGGGTLSWFVSNLCRPSKKDTRTINPISAASILNMLNECLLEPGFLHSFIWLSNPEVIWLATQKMKRTTCRFMSIYFGTAKSRWRQINHSWVCRFDQIGCLICRFRLTYFDDPFLPICFHHRTDGSGSARISSLRRCRWASLSQLA